MVAATFSATLTSVYRITWRSIPDHLSVIKMETFFFELVANCQTTRRRMPEYHSLHIYRHEILNISACRSLYVCLCEVRFQWRVVGDVECTVLKLLKPEENTFFEESNRLAIQLLRFVDCCVRSEVLFHPCEEERNSSCNLSFSTLSIWAPYLNSQCSPFRIVSIYFHQVLVFTLLLMLPENTFWNNRIQMSLFEELVFCLLSGGLLCSFHSRRQLITTLSLGWKNLICCLYSLSCDPHSW